MGVTKIAIKPEDPVMDSERVLDLLGRGFDGKYVTGAAEWLKNSYDQSLRLHDADEPPEIVFMVKTPRKTNASHWTMECLDFLGTTFEEINEHVKRWGS